LTIRLLNYQIKNKKISYHMKNTSNIANNLFLIALILVFPVMVEAQGIKNRGAKIVVDAGAVVNITGSGGHLLNQTNVTNGSVALSGTLKVSGNITNNVAASDIFSVAAAGSKVILNGTAAQTLGGTTTAPFVFDLLRISNPAGVTMAGNATVNSMLALKSGLVTTGSNVLTLGASCSDSGARASAYVNGKLARVISAAGSNISFPVGKGGNYRPLSVNFSTLTGTSTVTTEQIESLMPGTAPDNVTIFPDRYWVISQSGGSNMAYALTLNGTGFTPDGTKKMMKGDGSTNTGYDVTFSSPDYTNSTPFTSFSNFGLGYFCQPQVVTFTAIEAKMYGDAPFTVSATGGGSGNQVVFTSSDASVATCSGTNGATITILKAGTCTITATQAGTADYCQGQTARVLVVHVKPITVNPDAGQTKTYGSVDPTPFTYTLSPSLVGTDVMTGAMSRLIGNVPGNYSFTLGTLSAGANYTLTIATTPDFSITKKPLMPVVTVAAKCYDGNTDAVITSLNLTGVVTPDVVTVTGSSAFFDDAAPGDAKTVNITGMTLGGADAGNYVLSSTTTTTGTIYELPGPVISGTGSVTIYTSQDYTTETGMTGYNWAVAPSSGSITTGLGTRSVTVYWGDSGVHTVTVTYIDAHNCEPSVPSEFTVNVNPIPPSVAANGSPDEITSIDATSAIGNAQITATNGSRATSRGYISYLYDNTDKVIGDQGVTQVHETGDFGVSTYTISISSLIPNTHYSTRAFASNTAGSGYATRTDFLTLAAVPAAPAVGSPTAISLNVTVNANGNPSITQFAIHETSTNQYVQANGTLATPTVEWQTAAQWATITVTGLVTGATYTFHVKARNGIDVETDFGPTASGTTCTNPTHGGEIAQDQAICSGLTPVAFTSVSPASGQAGVLEYKWQSSVNSSATGFTDIASSDAETYAPGTLTQTTWYKRLARVTCRPDWTGAAESNVVSVTVYTIPTAGMTGMVVVCQNDLSPDVTFSGANGYEPYTFSYSVNASGTLTVTTTSGSSVKVPQSTATPGLYTYTLISVSDGHGCAQLQTGSITITVNPNGQVNQPDDEVACDAGTVPDIVFTTVNTGGTTTYAWTNDNTSIGLAASGNGNIASFTASNTTIYAEEATIVVTPTFTNEGVSCEGPSKTFTITVNPIPTVNPVASQRWCNGQVSTQVYFSGEVPGTYYHWVSSNPAIGTWPEGTGSNMPSFTMINNGTTIVSSTITVTPLFTSAGGTCAGLPTVFTLTVNPTPTVDPVSSQQLCHNQATLPVLFTGALPNTVFTWTNSDPSIGLAASGTGDLAASTAINTGSSPVVAHIAVTPWWTEGGVTCQGATIQFVIIVNPLPVPTITGPALGCTGSDGTYSTQPGMTNYLWNLSSGGTITAGGTVNDDFVTILWTTPGAHQVSVNYTTLFPEPDNPAGPYTLSGSISTAEANALIEALNPPGSHTPAGPLTPAGCTAPYPATLDVYVNPTATIGSSAVVCKGSPAPQVTFTGYHGVAPYTFWYNLNGGSTLSVTTTSGSSVLVSQSTAVAGNFDYQLSGVTDARGCYQAVSGSALITVNPIPTVDPVSGQRVCNQSATAEVHFTGTVEGTIFNWTNSNTAIGLAASGTVDIASFTAVNNGNTPATANITVTPSYTFGGVTCSGQPQSFAIIVNPVPTVNPVSDKTVCPGYATAPIAFTSPVAGTTYAWTNSDPSIGLAASGTGNIPSFMAINNGSSPVTATIAVTPTYTAGGVSCTGPVFLFTITVNPLPSIEGPVSACSGHPGQVYTTQAGMTSYTWTVSQGGTINAGGSSSDNYASVTWNAVGTQTITVNYTDGNGCRATSAIAKSVSVLRSPSPTIEGSSLACEASANNIYTTEKNKASYSWTVSAGGTITDGGGMNDNSVTVTWNTPGVQAVSVNYADPSGCGAAIATVKTVTVNPLPVPVIAGPDVVCINSAGHIYSTQPGNSGYVWTISSGGTITAGGTATDNSVTVTWNNAGSQFVSVSYTNATGCTAAAPSNFTVTVNPRPAAVISGPATACANTAGNYYTAPSGMTGYQWTLSPGGLILSGAGTPMINVIWVEPGPQSVSVNYANTSGCALVQPAAMTVTVSAPAVSTVTGQVSACVHNYETYTTSPGMSGYHWTVSAGGVLFTPQGTDAMTVLWNTDGPQWVQVAFTDANGCASQPLPLDVTVKPRPTPTISGPVLLCSNRTAIYTTETGMTGYNWNIPPEGTIVAGAGTSQITVLWTSPGTHHIELIVTAPNGCTNWYQATYPVTVIESPVPVITGPTPVTINSTGNVYTTQPGMNNYAWSVSPGGTITAGGTSADNSVTVTWNQTGEQTVGVNYALGNGCSAASPTLFTVTVNPAIPTNLEVNGLTITDTRCYNALQTITVAGGGTYFTITPTGSVTMIAGQKILYLPGTTVQSGGYLHGFISPEGPWCGEVVPTIPNTLQVVTKDEGRGTKDEGRGTWDEGRTWFRVFPNPTEGWFKLEVFGADGSSPALPHRSEIVGKVTIEIYGMNGSRILTRELDGLISSAFSLDAQPAGVYLIRIVSDDQVNTLRILKK
jgi:hypothetical protein